MVMCGSKAIVSLRFTWVTTYFPSLNIKYVFLLKIYNERHPKIAIQIIYKIINTQIMYSSKAIAQLNSSYTWATPCAHTNLTKLPPQRENGILKEEMKWGGALWWFEMVQNVCRPCRPNWPLQMALLRWVEWARVIQFVRVRVSFSLFSFLKSFSLVSISIWQFFILDED